MRHLVLFLTASELILAPADAANSGRGFDMDYGPFLAYTVQSTNETVTKGVTIKLQEGTNSGAVLFDTETLRYAAGWTGGWLDLSTSHLASYKGALPPRLEGQLQFTTKPGPGWAKDGSFADARTNGLGPLPRDWAKWKGIYVQGDKVVLSYSVQGVDVLELPEMCTNNGAIGFVRNLSIAPSSTPLRLLVAGDEGAEAHVESTTHAPGEHTFALFTTPTLAIVCTPHLTAYSFHVADARPVKLEGVQDILGGPRPASVRQIGSQVVLEIPPHERPLLFRLEIFDLKQYLDNKSSANQPSPVVDPLPFIRAAPARFPQTITTSGKLGDDSAPFAVDTVTIPENNPWRSWMRLTALDFFSDGRAAVTTWNGDVWVVSRLDDDLRNVQWKRFATGLFDPLGLKIVRDQVFVLERSQITRLHDLNGDGEADFYENFNNDAGVSPSYHAFAMDLQTDSAGNFYYTRAGQRVDTMFALNGGMVRVSADGSRAELIAHGLRAANGMGIGPNAEITCSDNQGNWIPASRINLIHPGGFYGYVPHAHSANELANFQPPICWIPMNLDNSSGGQVWVTSSHWPAPLTNHLLHTSYGMAAMFEVLWETVDGVPQGGVVKLPLRFESGIQRARFNPRDGQLWVVGLKGWQTKGVKDGALQRVRYTGGTLRMPNELHVRRDGIEISFTDPLDRAATEDLQNWKVEQWNYRWSEKYGSDDYSVANPDKKGRDVVTIRAVKLSTDRQRVMLEIASLQPVMQMQIKFAVKSADGAPVEWEIYNTINRVPK